MATAVVARLRSKSLPETRPQAHEKESSDRGVGGDQLPGAHHLVVLPCGADGLVTNHAARANMP